MRIKTLFMQWRKWLIGSGIGAGVLLTLLLARTGWLPSRQLVVAPMVPMALDTKRVSEHLSRAIQFETISHQEPHLFKGQPFQALAQYVQTIFPSIHKTLKREFISKYSMLYTWPGQDPDLPPVLLMAHSDVVPVEAAARAKWKYPPFAGTIAAGYIWGRGTLDVKSGLMGMLEAIELLARKGFKPKQTLLLAFGHDEEIGGRQGNLMIAEQLKQRVGKLALVVDEGGQVVETMMPGVAAPVAVIGIAEKGYASLELTLTGEGGHSSTPPLNSTIGRLGQALQRLEGHPFPVKLDGPTSHLFDYVTPEMSGPLRLLFANRWLFKPLLMRQLTQARATNAVVRTTTAVTMFQAGVKDNVIPTEAKAVINFRILPGETIQDVQHHVKDALNDPAITIKLLPMATNPSDVSSPDTPGFTLLHRTIKEVLPGTVVAPYLMVGATDARHYSALCSNIYRFLPLRLNPSDLSRIHGIDERISVDAYLDVVRYYHRLITNLNQL